MLERSPRRRILCIRPRQNPVAGKILTTTSDEWLRALELHCDITVIDEDFDLKAVCERVRPDMMILDAVNWIRPWPLTITNARACLEIPRVLYLNSDPHDPMRPLTARMVDDLGIETVFVTAEAYRQQMPELRHQDCYFAHQFIDDGIYKDYGLPKSIPVSIFGGQFMGSFYPWRVRAIEELPNVIPTLVYTHPGYTKQMADPFAVIGESYARLLNRCYFSAADTTRLDYLVRKHLEIPASGCVLIAPESQALSGYGFVDLQNCVLGEGPELYEKLTQLAADPDAYERIRRAGMGLVHGRFTQKTWTFFLDWLDCREALQPGQKVQQTGLYGCFKIVPASPAVASVETRPSGDNQMTAALREVRSAILSGQDLEAAETLLEKVAAWITHVAEPFFLYGIVLLLRGDAVGAAMAIGSRAECQGAMYSGLDILDPAEIAWIMLIARIVGNVGLEQVARERAREVRHVALRRMVWVLDGARRDALTRDLSERQRTDVLSIHWLGDEDFATWYQLVSRVLAANRMHSVFAYQMGESLSLAA